MTPLPKPAAKPNPLPRIPGLRYVSTTQRKYDRTPAAELLRRNRRAAPVKTGRRVPMFNDTIRAIPGPHPDDEMDDGFYRACLLAPRIVGDDGVPMLVALRLYQAGLVEVVE